MPAEEIREADEATAVWCKFGVEEYTEAWRRTLNNEKDAKITAGSKFFLVSVYVTNAIHADSTGRENATA